MSKDLQNMEENQQPRSPTSLVSVKILESGKMFLTLSRCGELTLWSNKKNENESQHFRLIWKQDLDPLKSEVFTSLATGTSLQGYPYSKVSNKRTGGDIILQKD